MRTIVKYFVFASCLFGADGTENTCVMTESTGCINGSPYDFETQFVCGSMQAGNVPPIYDRETQGCCNQGQPYSKDLEFCCANTLYPHGAGDCVRWLRSETEKFPDCYNCEDSGNRALSYLDALGVTETDLTTESVSEESKYLEEDMEEFRIKPSASQQQEENSLESEDEKKLEEEEEYHRQLATWPTSNPFDTIANGPSPTPCLEMDDKNGCYNTYSYVYVTHYPCYDLLLTWSVYGCCDGIPYRHQSQTCCFLDGEYVVKNANTWCTCQSYECAPSAAPSKKPTSKKPTRAPTLAPTPEPTLTVYPTGLPTLKPTNVPTLTYRPTPLVAKKSTDDDEFNVEYIYGGGGVLILGMAGLMYLQGRAARLIKQRHTIVQEIDEIYS